MRTLREFSFLRYLERALELAEFEPDGTGWLVARVPGVDGLYAQGETEAGARQALRDVVEGNLVLALQLDLPIALLPGVEISEQWVA